MNSISNKGAFDEQGIVLHTTKYGERKIIVHLLSKREGRKSYITTISNSRKAISSSPRELFHPLSIINFQGQPSKGEISKMSQCSAEMPLYQITGDIVKGSISLFIAELLYRLVREPDQDPMLFDFTKSAILGLDAMEEGVSNFHIWFLVRFTYFMGYGLSSGYNEGSWLDIQTGEYTPMMPLNPMRIAPEYAQSIAHMQNIELERLSEISLNRETRRILLDALIDYYNYHSGNFTTIHSLDILRELF